MKNDMLITIDETALETVTGGNSSSPGIGATIGGLLDDALGAVGEVAGGVLGLFGGLLSGLGDFISKLGSKF